LVVCARAAEHPEDDCGDSRDDQGDGDARGGEQ
jgi:hypothetical protein